MLKESSVNIPRLEALKQMPSYAKFKKDLFTKKRIVSYKVIDGLHHRNEITYRFLVQKEK